MMEQKVFVVSRCFLSQDGVAKPVNTGRLKGFPSTITLSQLLTSRLANGNDVNPNVPLPDLSTSNITSMAKAFISHVFTEKEPLGVPSDLDTPLYRLPTDQYYVNFLISPTINVAAVEPEKSGIVTADQVPAEAPGAKKDVPAVATSSSSDALQQRSRPATAANRSRMPIKRKPPPVPTSSKPDSEQSAEVPFPEGSQPRYPTRKRQIRGGPAGKRKRKTPVQRVKKAAVKEGAAPKRKRGRPRLTEVDKLQLKSVVKAAIAPVVTAENSIPEPPQSSTMTLAAQRKIVTVPQRRTTRVGFPQLARRSNLERQSEATSTSSSSEATEDPALGPEPEEEADVDDDKSALHRRLFG